MSNLVNIANISAIPVISPAPVPANSINILPNTNTNINTNKVIATEALIMNRFATLADEFNKLKTSTKDVNVLAAKVKEMRIEHGKIVSSFHKTISENDKKFTEEEYFTLSTLDSSMTNTRRILNDAEAFI